MRQLTLSKELKSRVIHGGEHSIGKRKTARPIATKRAMHLVMRSTQAKGEKSFLHPRYAQRIRDLVQRLAKENEIQIYEFSNNGNHLHLLIRARRRDGFKRFLRLLAGRIAMRVGGGRKGNALVKKFWDLPAFTRIVEGGKAFVIARKYVIQNILEAIGAIDVVPRKKKPKIVGGS